MPDSAVEETYQEVVSSLSLKRFKCVANSLKLNILPVSNLDSLEVERQEVRLAVGRALELARNCSAQELFELAKVRVLFETLVLEKYGHECLPEMKRHHARMKEIAATSQICNSLSECWEIDGAFHSAVFKNQSFTLLADLADDLISECKSVGMPNSGDEVREVIEEHSQILLALESNRGDEVFQSVKAHIFKAYERWTVRMDATLVTEKSRTYPANCYLDEVELREADADLCDEIAHYSGCQAERLNELKLQTVYDGAFVILKEGDRPFVVAAGNPTDREFEAFLAQYHGKEPGTENWLLVISN